MLVGGTASRPTTLACVTLEVFRKSVEVVKTSPIVKRSRCEPVGSIVQVVLGFSGGGTRIDYRDWMESLFQCKMVQYDWGNSLSHREILFSHPICAREPCGRGWGGGFIR